MTAKIGLFYGSSTCYTEMAGEKICEQINSNFKNNVVSLHNIADVPVSQMADFDYLILGIPTWDYGELQEDWETHWDQLDNIDFSRKPTQSGWRVRIVTQMSGGQSTPPPLLIPAPRRRSRVVSRVVTASTKSVSSARVGSDGIMIEVARTNAELIV